MASKKYLIVLASIFTLFSFTQVNAQSSGVYNLTSYDYTDSSLIPEKRMDQQSDFMNNRYLYPSKPRNQWEVGLSFGALNVSGDVRSSNIFNQAVDPIKTLAFGINVRKAWGYVISTRLQYLHGSASGMNYEMANGHLSANTGVNGNPWKREGYRNAYYNYHTKVRQLSLDAIAALNNIRYHKGSNKMSLYALGGIGGLLYQANNDVKNGDNTYINDFADIQANNQAPSNGHIFEKRKDIRTALKNALDGEYESPAERHGNRGWYNDYTFRPTANVGLGISWRLGKRVSLSLEDKVIFTMDDLVDGQRWQNQDHDALTRDFDNINYLSLGIGVNLGNNAVAPLWWVNPNEFMYNGLATVGNPVGKCDADKDGDGVSDCYDRCGDTPGGVAVDTHGCPLDTDGDGVADYKDKQLITPTECQPSDADGIGKCPDPECCKNGPVVGCGSIGNGSVMFSGGSRSLSSSAKNQLNNLANSMRSNPNCKVVVMGNGSSSKVAQQRSWDRANAVINYMVDRNGVDRGRFIMQYGLGGNPNAVDYRAAGDGETGPSNTPPPFPNLKR
jgi:outer membrane protein OmpA-like peptidoglycan-associated protein